ncbi:MAG: DUF2855 family protein [Alphaproteobacteria bacterium]|nr:DUF2855 family protein [Alphaproteobacteria bacterium]
MGFEIHVDREDIRRAELVQIAKPDLGEGEALLAIEGFALTTNNVTYAATGDVIGYWKFFPTKAINRGIVPVWGFARVQESNSADLKIGTRIYGFFPMASHLVITPKTSGNTIRDDAPHRRELPPVYNIYQYADQASLQEDALQAIFAPLLITSYLLFDFLQDNNWFGAEQIIIGSASSKTGLGLSHFLSEMRPDGPRVVGLTSANNRDFVTALGTCDQVVTYDNITAEIAQIPSVYVDMAGNAKVRLTLHQHINDKMLHSAAVGTSHWDKFEPTGEMPGARPRFFFAPSQIEKRRGEWPKGEVEKRLHAAWSRVARQSADWMTLNTVTDPVEAALLFSHLANGHVNPKIGHYVDLAHTI